MITREIRSYEISIWTLQDDFITVLKYSDIEHKGQTQEGEMQLNVDGTQTLSFTIPMYLHKNNKLVENPAWYNYINGNIIANMRKIKVILNKLTPDEEIFEFIITKVTETHEKGELKCAVECEGLAFHELGKTGYKISLKQEDFEFDSGCFYGLYVEDRHPKGEWNNPIKNVPDTTEPIANIEYWANKFLVPYPQNGLLNPRIWYYKVEMDWSGHTNWKWENEENILIARASNKIYEDEYVGNWRTSGTTADNYVLEADTLVGYMEKARLMDSEESNKYNLSQDLAEKFGVYCKYVYEHDDTYHIIGRYVVFYNSFIEEQKGAIDITYKYNAKKIEREMDGTDLVTKMYIKSVEDDSSASGLISIVDVEANKTREDYLLNFDYMYNIGAISKESYEEISAHEQRLRYYNDKLVPLSKQIVELQFKKPEVEAKVTFYEHARQLDQEQIQAQNDWINAVTNNSGKITTRNNLNPQTAIVLDENGSFYINISTEGIISSTLRCYKTYSSTEHTLKNDIPILEIIYDEFNFVKRINLETSFATDDSRIVYLTYDYSPTDYHQKIKEIWTSRLYDDTNSKAEAEDESNNITKKLRDIQSEYDDLLKEKQAEIAAFEHMMGPALREGNWQPEDYKDYGDKHVYSLALFDAQVLPIEEDIETLPSEQIQLVWSQTKFDEELKSYYEIQANQQKEYCLAIKLTDDILEILGEHRDKIDKLCLLYYDFNSVNTQDSTVLPHHLPQYRRALGLNSKCFFTFIKEDDNSSIAPYLLITGTDELSENQLLFLTNGTDSKTGLPVRQGNWVEEKDYPALGTLTVENENNTYTVSENLWVTMESVQYLSRDAIIYYPRIIINSLGLKTSSDELIVSLDGLNKPLSNYEDYTVLTHETDECYYITIKPETLIENFYEQWNTITGKVRYSISNASTAIYLDAIQVLKDSSIPQVSYSVDVSLIQKDRIKTTAKLLNRIVHINDNELKFENVQGYVSEVTLNLDEPWEDKIEIKNYKTKFEDLFEKIVASSEQMKKNEYITGIVSDAFDNEGLLRAEAAQEAANKIANYNFDGGNLTITKEHGILAESKEGIVSMRGDGIFTATEKDEEGNWLWNSGITPSGINANLITAGQIDTNRLRIFAGDQLRFQMNADGLFAYKNDDEDGADIDNYVKMYEDGLVLHKHIDANGGTAVVDFDQVEISWKGFTIRNYFAARGLVNVFFADNQGNLSLTGEINAESGQIGDWTISADGEGIYYINSTPSGEVNAWNDSELYLGKEGLKLGNAFEVKTKTKSLTDETRLFDNFIIYDPSKINEENNDFLEDDYLFKIAPRYDETGALTGDYGLDVQNIEFEDGFIESLITRANIGTYRTTEMGNNNIPSFDEDAPNGSIGIFYTEENEPGASSQITTSFSADSAPWASNETTYYPSPAGTDGHTGSKFNISLKRWNVTTGSGDIQYSGDFVRVGVAYTNSNTAGAIGRMQVKNDSTSAKLLSGGTLKLTIQYTQSIGSNYDQLKSGATRSTGILLDIYKYSSGSYIKVASGTVTIPPATYTGSTSPITKTFSLKTIADIDKGNILYAVFYSKTARSLTYINVQNMRIGAVSSTQPDENNYSLWIKSKGIWNKIAGNGTLAPVTPDGTTVKVTNNILSTNTVTT